MWHLVATVLMTFLRINLPNFVRRVYDSRHLQADCQEPGSAPEPYVRQSSMSYLYLSYTELEKPVSWTQVSRYAVDRPLLRSVLWPRADCTQWRCLSIACDRLNTARWRVVVFADDSSLNCIDLYVLRAAAKLLYSRAVSVPDMPVCLSVCLSLSSSCRFC